MQKQENRRKKGGKFELDMCLGRLTTLQSFHVCWITAFAYLIIVCEKKNVNINQISKTTIHNEIWEFYIENRRKVVQLSNPIGIPSASLVKAVMPIPSPAISHPNLQQPRSRTIQPWTRVLPAPEGDYGDADIQAPVELVAREINEDMVSSANSGLKIQKCSTSTFGKALILCMLPQHLSDMVAASSSSPIGGR